MCYHYDSTMIFCVKVAEVEQTQLISERMIERPLVAAWLAAAARQVSRHEVDVARPQAVAYRAVLDLPLAELPLTRALFVLRRIAYRRDMTVRELFTTPPFRLLEEQGPLEIVFEVSRLKFRAVGQFRVEPRGAGARVITATWVETWGWLAPVAFRLYWLVVRPFSGMIRREILRAAKRRAESIAA